MSHELASTKLHPFSGKYLPVRLLIDHHQVITEVDNGYEPYVVQEYILGSSLQDVLITVLKTPFRKILEKVLVDKEEKFGLVRDVQLGGDLMNVQLTIIPCSGNEKKEHFSFLVIFQPILPVTKQVIINDRDLNISKFDELPEPKDFSGKIMHKKMYEDTVDMDIGSLQEKYEHFRNIINNLPGAVIRYQINADGSESLIYMSEQAELLWEIDSKKAKKNVTLLWEPILKEDLAAMQSSIMESAKNLSLWKNNWRIKTTSGKIKWLEAIGKPIRTDQGDTYWDTLIMDVTEKKKSELELAKKSLFLERTESVANLGSWEWDIASDRVEWSAEVFRIFGLEFQENAPSIEEQKPYYESSSFDVLEKAINHSLKYDETYEVEVILNPSKGGQKHCVCRGMPRKNAAGKITHLYGSIQDITRLKETEIRLRESREMLNNIADNIPGIVYRYQLFPDGKDQLLYLSKGVDNLLGISYEEAFANVNLLWECIYPDDLDKYKASVEKSARELSFWEVEHRIIMSDGRIKWIKGLGKPHMRKDGSIIWDSMGIEITEMKEASEKLKTLKDQLDLAVAIAELGVFSYYTATDCLEISPRMMEILEADAPDHLHSFMACLHEDDRDLAQNILNANLAGEKKYHQQLRIYRKDDRIGYISISSVPIWENGRVTRILGIVYDITRFKEIEHDLSIARDNAESSAKSLTLKNAELKKANEELDHFVYSTSHNLRAPLSSILGLTELMKEQSGHSKQLEYISYIEKSIHRLDETILEITTYSKNNRLNTQYKQVLFKDFLEEVRQSLNYMDHAKRLSFKLDIPENMQFYTDPFRLKIIFENLLSNAVKYQDFHKDKSILSISTSPRQRDILIRIEDNGIGIRKDSLKRVFDMFYRGSSQSFGSGLGLYIVREAVGKLDGEITLESEYGTGTTYEIRLPHIDPVLTK